MYLLILLILVVVFYKKKDGFSNLSIKRDQNNNEQKIELDKKVAAEKAKLMKEAEKRFRTKKDKITNEERKGILTSYI